MPTLLSPFNTTSKTPEAGDDGVVKKPKGVMGRIKSTFKLGRRKSSTGSTAATAAAAVPVVVHDKQDVPTDEPQVTEDNETDRTDKQEEEDEEEAVETYKEDDDTTEIKQFTVVEHDDDDTRQQQEQESTAVESAVSLIAEEKEQHDRVTTFELKARDEPEAKDEEEDDEEIFSCDYKPGEGPQPNEVKPQEDEEDEEDEVVEVFAETTEQERPLGVRSSGNQSPPARAAAQVRSVSAPHESDLVVVGVSPAKLHTRTALGPSSSPVRRSQPPCERDEGNQETARTGTGPSRADTEPGLGDRIASAHSTRPTRQPPALSSSPPRRAQLLSEFQFGTDATATASPVPSSPMKRRTNPTNNGSPSPSVPTWRSFQREHEQPLSINASSPTASSPPASPIAKRKPDTPSAAPSTRTSRPERRNSLQGITEEAHSPPSSSSTTTSTTSTHEPTLPPRPSAGTGRRRVASSIEAPILASSFGAASPEVHDDHEAATSSSEPVSLPHHDRETATKDTTAFDAGAAITLTFGERVARLLGADPWGDRQDGLDAVLYHLKKTDLASAPQRRELLCAALAAVQCGVDDRVAPVLYCALECLRGVLKEFAVVIDRSFLKHAPLNEQLSRLTRAIVNKLGDSNKRTQREATQAVVRLAKLKKLKVLPHVLLHLSAKEVAPRHRVETLRVLVKELGVDAQTALNVEVAMQFAVPVLKSADDKTRKAAVELIAELHVVNAQAVSAQLTTGVKPEMLRVITRRVDELLAQRQAAAMQPQQQQQAQTRPNANQTEEGDHDDGNTTTMVLVAVPSEDTKAIQTLLETLLVQAQGVVGPVVWRKLESKTWSDRKEALSDVDKTITEAKSDLRDVKPAFQSVVQHNFVAYCTVVYRSLGDAIAPVVNSAMAAFATLVKVYGPCVEWREDPVRDMILLTIMRLFGTMQKPNSRTNRAACRCILKLARLNNPHTLRYAVSCVCATDTDVLVQMHLLRLLVPEFGFQSEGISAHVVMALVAPALAHSSDKVRKTATDVALCTQRLMGKAFVLQKLQDVVKPVTLKELEKQFVDLEMIQTDSARPQTVHATAVPSGAANALPPVQFGGDQARRLLHSAPVGVGKLHCTPPERESENDGNGPPRRASVLSNDEENLMDAILGSDDF